MPSWRGSARIDWWLMTSRGIAFARNQRALGSAVYLADERRDTVADSGNSPTTAAFCARHKSLCISRVMAPPLYGANVARFCAGTKETGMFATTYEAPLRARMGGNG